MKTDQVHEEHNAKARTHRSPLSFDEKVASWRTPKLAAIERTKKTVATKRRELNAAQAKLAQAERDLVRIDAMIASAKDDEERMGSEPVPVPSLPALPDERAAQ